MIYRFHFGMSTSARWLFKAEVEALTLKLVSAEINWLTWNSYLVSDQKLHKNTYVLKKNNNFNIYLYFRFIFNFEGALSECTFIGRSRRRFSAQIML